MVRLFHVYYPIRMLVLLTCEAFAIAASFVTATERVNEFETGGGIV